MRLQPPRWFADPSGRSAPCDSGDAAEDAGFAGDGDVSEAWDDAGDDIAAGGEVENANIGTSSGAPSVDELAHRISGVELQGATPAVSARLDGAGVSTSNDRTLSWQV